MESVGEHESAELMVRAALAGAVRMQAATLRSTAELLGSQAAALETYAQRIEEGLEFPQAPVRLAVVSGVPVDGGGDDETAGETAPLERVTRGPGAGVTPADGMFSDGMAEWLDQFDDRIAGSLHFVSAVNEAVELGMTCTEVVARVVADRVRELDAAAVTRSER